MRAALPALSGRRDSAARRHQMRERLVAIGDDFWAEVARIKERPVRVRDTMQIDLPSGSATVKKALVGLRARFGIDVDGGTDLSAHGNLVDHEYGIESGGDTVATVSKKWFRVRDSHGVEVAAGQGVPLILPIVVCIDELTRD